MSPLAVGRLTIRDYTDEHRGLWDAFVAHQQQLARGAQEDFNKVFGRDFMAAYRAELRRLKS